MYKTILLPVDLNHDSSWKRALPTAVEYCKAFGSKLHILTVVPDFGMPIVASYFPADFAEKAHAATGKELARFISEHVPGEIEVHAHVCTGTVYEEIRRTAREIGADLIVMASHRPELSDYLVGPNAERVVRHALRSVLVVRD